MPNFLVIQWHLGREALQKKLLRRWPLPRQKARDAGFDAIGVSIEQLDRAHFYPEKKLMGMEIVVDKTTRRVLGMQGTCEDGDAVKAPH